MLKTSCRRRRCGPFGTSAHLLAETAVPGSSESSATHVVAGAVAALQALTDPFDEEQHHGERPPSDPETLLLRTDNATLIERAMNNLPDRFRQLLVLRELEGLSYQELADVLEIPIGTVMSRLSRARDALRGALDSELKPSRIATRTRVREQEADAVLV